MPEQAWKHPRNAPRARAIPFLLGMTTYSKAADLVRFLVATIRFSPFTCCFCNFLGIHSRVLFATRTPNSHNHSYVHYSVSKFTGEWFTNHSNHIHIVTPITGIVATKVWLKKGFWRGTFERQSWLFLRQFSLINVQCWKSCLQHAHFTSKKGQVLNVL